MTVTTNIRIACAIAGTLLLAGCGSSAGRAASDQTTSVSDVIQQQAQGDGTGGSEAGGGSFRPDEKPAFETVDYDLTEMSSDMVYATVSDMISSPDTYKSKTVRITGPFRHAHSDEYQSDYFAVLIKDAAACCSQGFEFVWADGSHAWPADYPAEDTEVVVTGSFDTYREGDTTYCHLVGASLQEA